MAPDDFIQSLQQIRIEVQALYAMHCMARIDLDRCVESVFRLIDQEISAAARASVSNLVQTARNMNREVVAANRLHGRYFGVVLDRNIFGLLIANRTNTAIVIPLSDIADLDKGPTTGDQIAATYSDGRCEIKIRT
ncbi:hypothetical protein [Ralstonia solanacearum]|uniref:hypothetical protein n=1 Tax=Ralstonia solanacearum TaxID=305 RepID=UPI001865AB4F|nr:hypothetical protein [Ralstonia solanacearum]QOK81203.1 hypothetical protein HF906_02915 [Ralstonia solanacearum]